MFARQTLLAVLCLAILRVSLFAPATAAQSFRLGDQPYRVVDDAPGRAFTRMAPTTNAYFRPTPTGDDQIGPPPPPDQVSRLADELGHHLKMSYKHDVPEYNRRYVHFRNVMDEWDKSPKGIPQQVQMTQWLKTSIQYSMPGSDNFLPPMPKMNPINLNSDSARLKGVEDPFRDDPVQAAPM